MSDLAVMLKVRGRRCVVVGGGPVALRRTQALLDCGADVTVVAPQMNPQFADLSVTLVRRGYEPGDLDGAYLVIVATDDVEVNTAADDDARRCGALVNRADDPDAGDFTVPAQAHHGPLTLAVDTGGVSAAAAAAIRDQLSAALDPDWPRLLELARPYRALIQQRFTDAGERRDRLKRLTDSAAMTMLKAQGDEALRQHLTALCRPA